MQVLWSYDQGELYLPIIASLSGTTVVMAIFLCEMCVSLFKGPALGHLLDVQSFLFGVEQVDTHTVDTCSSN